MQRPTASHEHICARVESKEKMIGTGTGTEAHLGMTEETHDILGK